MGVAPSQEHHGHSHGDAAHGHSHNGQPCHGHGEANQTHNTSNEASHGHSHNGKPCHGHGESNGHSHGSDAHGHSHGGDAHGHSHGGDAAHGHSHNGKPCHGHGPAAQQKPQVPPAVAKKFQAINIFNKNVITPKLPIVFEHFHANKTKKFSKITSHGLSIPLNQNEVMTNEEFSNFISAYLLGIANFEGHGVVRTIDVEEMTASLKNRLKVDSITQPQFISLCSFVLGRTAMSNFLHMNFVLRQIGLEKVKIPNIPMLPEEIIMNQTTEYAKAEILPNLTEHISKLLESKKDNEDPNNEVITEVQNNIIEGLNESKSSHPYIPRLVEQLQQIPTSALVGEIKVNKDDKFINPGLFAYLVINSIVIPVLNMDPETLKNVFKHWSIDFDVEVEEEPTADIDDIVDSIQNLDIKQ